jgi:HSP20 family protein
MSGARLIPWNWKKKRVAMDGRRPSEHPVVLVQRHLAKVLADLNGLIPEALSEPIQQFGERWGSFSPNVDVVRSDNELTVRVEVPGMDEKDIELTLVPDGLVIRGEKRPAHRLGAFDSYTESAYGAFERVVSFRLEDIDQERVEARASKGILTVHLPFTEASLSSAKKVAIRSFD